MGPLRRGQGVTPHQHRLLIALQVLCQLCSPGDAQRRRAANPLAGLAALTAYLITLSPQDRRWLFPLLRLEEESLRLSLSLSELPALRAAVSEALAAQQDRLAGRARG